jgi:hypothetical protein
MMKWMLVFLVACGSNAASVAPRERVPDAVEASARKLAGGAPIDRIEREHEGTYEATWHVNSLEREAQIRADGSVVNVEEEVAPADVPEPVRAAAIAKLGTQAAIKYVRMSSGVWEAESHIDGEEHELHVQPDGREVEHADDDDDGEDDDD